MGWAILAVAIFAILFIMILMPKATKGWDLAWGKGFARIYYVLAFVISALLALRDNMQTGHDDFTHWAFGFIFFFGIAFIGFKIFTWIFRGFIKKKN